MCCFLGFFDGIFDVYFVLVSEFVVFYWYLVGDEDFMFGDDVGYVVGGGCCGLWKFDVEVGEVVCDGVYVFVFLELG